MTDFRATTTAVPASLESALARVSDLEAMPATVTHAAVSPAVAARAKAWLSAWWGALHELAPHGVVILPTENGGISIEGTDPGSGILVEWEPKP